MSVKLSSLQKGLVMHLPLDQESYNPATKRFSDRSAYSNHGTAANAAVFAADRMGQVNRATDFNGTSDYINCGNDTSLDCATLTLNALVKVDTYTHPYGIVTKGISGSISNPPYCFYLTASGFVFYTVNSVGTPKMITAAGYNDTSHWYNLVGTFDGTHIHFYIDRDEIGTGTPQTDIAATTGALVIGQQKLGFSRFLDGTIGEVNIWNRVLSDQGRTSLYESYRPKVTI